MQNIFQPADILLPDFARVSAEKWSVIACDQFTGDPDYWKRTQAFVGDAPSSLRLILPEIYLEEPDVRERIHGIHDTMKQYLREDLFQIYENAMVYVERVQKNGVLRTGVIGKIDLEAYNYNPSGKSPVRATEATVLERIPSRMKVRMKAVLESPHIMILIDDPGDLAIGSCTAVREEMRLLYSTQLMENGGSVKGWLMDEAQQNLFQRGLASLFAGKGEDALLYAVGDGNHSLATAKACYEKLKQANPDLDLSDHPARYALVEVVNLHSPALQFEAIHRIVTRTDVPRLLDSLTAALCLSEEESEQPVTILHGGSTRTLYIHKPTSNLAVGSLQNALDAYFMANTGKIDYIHGTETVERLSRQPGSVGFLLPDLHKSLLFPSVQKDGALPRKTFSMGRAEDKRYYMECRKIR